MRTTALTWTAWVGLALAVPAQSPITYFNGPAFPIPLQEAVTDIDIDRDGLADFSFVGGLTVCTTDIPISGCGCPSYVSALNTNGVLCLGNEVLAVPTGTPISSTTSSNAAWLAGNAVVVASYFFSPRNGTSGWGGPLSRLGEGYAGVRIHASDGFHYGWIRVSVPPDGDMTAATVLDWAYETRPDTAIVAGAVPSAQLAAPRIVRANNLRLNWPADPGMAYQVQFKEQVNSPTWTNLLFTVIATGTNVTIDVPITGTARFYRVVQTP